MPSTAEVYGNYDISTNGTFDISGYKTVRVNIDPREIVSGNLNIVKNSDDPIDVAQYSTVTVKVPASALADEANIKNITANGKYDVLSFAYADVQVPPRSVTSGTKTIDANGTYDVIEYQNVKVAVPDTAASRIGIEFTKDASGNFDGGIKLSKTGSATISIR